VSQEHSDAAASPDPMGAVEISSHGALERLTEERA